MKKVLLTGMVWLVGNVALAQTDGYRYNNGWNQLRGTTETLAQDGHRYSNGWNQLRGTGRGHVWGTQIPRYAQPRTVWKRSTKRNATEIFHLPRPYTTQQPGRTYYHYAPNVTWEFGGPRTNVYYRYGDVYWKY
jgi:hypothetical protein